MSRGMSKVSVGGMDVIMEMKGGPINTDFY